MQKIKSVILCGGKGTRMGDTDLPKVLLPVGGKPILWHVMNIYAHFGVEDFVLCLGYKGDKIREYFHKTKKWKITFAETGESSNTGDRIKKIAKYIDQDTFFATYGDGVADINLPQLLNFHQRHKKAVTITVTRPLSQFGIVGVHPKTQTVTHFEEKPILDHWINGGFFVFEPEIFDLLTDDQTVLEEFPLGALADNGKMTAFKHKGFWHAMDTLKDRNYLEKLWSTGNAPWKVWQ
jgi:glucose-1-phosphate cytidylyltransferase